MSSKQFIVDLGKLELTDDQRQSLNSAIQGAVTQELARFRLKNRIVLIPVDRWPKGPILEGIIARPLDKNLNAEINSFLH